METWTKQFRPDAWTRVNRAWFKKRAQAEKVCAAMRRSQDSHTFERHIVERVDIPVQNCESLAGWLNYNTAEP